MRVIEIRVVAIYMELTERFLIVKFWVSSFSHVVSLTAFDVVLKLFYKCWQDSSSSRVHSTSCVLWGTQEFDTIMVHNRFQQESVKEKSPGPSRRALS